jgi:lariat debranching enzyme
MPKALNIAVLGCCHGELNHVYRSIAERSADKAPIDLLIIGGDFQAVRNHADLACMSVPAKYKRLGDFHKYYSGEVKAPLLTIFVGGNHESSAYMQELYHGGWVAPNIYYLGNAGIVRFRGLKIAGISGIWQKEHYIRGYNECPPYTPSSLRSVYHVRRYEVERLLTACQAQPNVDVLLSHDWPRGIEQYGDTAALLRKKPFFKAEIARNDLGSPANETLLHVIKPRYWFSAHLHVRFHAEVIHDKSRKRRRSSTSASAAKNPDEIALDLSGDDASVQQANPDEIALNLSDEEERPADPEKDAAELAQYKQRVLQRFQLAQDTKAPEPSKTHFLALDKCLPGRHFLEYLCIEPLDNDDEQGLYYDATWLATTRAMAPYFSTGAYQCPLPGQAQLLEKVSEARKWVDANVPDLRIPFNFEQTAPAEIQGAQRAKLQVCKNSQTTKFVKMLGIAYPFVKQGSGWEARPIRH